jgi:hypothetical protein
MHSTPNALLHIVLHLTMDDCRGVKSAGKQNPIVNNPAFGKQINGVEA